LGQQDLIAMNDQEGESTGSLQTLTGAFQVSLEQKFIQ
jgi:hypothetical protein